MWEMSDEEKENVNANSQDSNALKEMAEEKGINVIDKKTGDRVELKTG